MNATIEKTNYMIDDIEALTEQDARNMSAEAWHLKGFTVYIIDFGGYFGYSAVVYKDGRQIKYANDYALHHNGKSRDELRAWYEKTMNSKLFTDEELTAPLASYDDLRARRNFVHNLMPLEYDYLSIFRIVQTREEEAAFEREKKSYPFYCPPAFAYFKDREAVERINGLYIKLAALEEDMQNSFELLKSAIKYEMANHEYHINWQGDWDVCSCFGNVHYKDAPDALNSYFDELGWNDEQRRAYYEARREFLKEANRNGWC